MGIRSLIAGVMAKRPRSTTRRPMPVVPGLTVESLEERVVLYAVTGNAWPDPRVVTISFVPDGTDLGGVSSNLNAAFNSNPYLGDWQNEILRAAQSWTQATNINFVLVSDNGAPIGSGAYQQGAPTFGDIRIGGYDFGSSSLASAVFPPPGTNFSAAGDIEFNTASPYSMIGSGFDLYTVAVHEFGHALGLDHSTVTTAQMYPIYNAVKTALTSDDIAGIRNIYSNNGARTNDDYDLPSANNTVATASNITSELVRAKKWAILTELDITTPTDVDFYKVKIPSWAGDSLTVKVQSAGLSLLQPKLTIYAEDKTTVLGTADGLNQYGSTLSLTVNGISTGDWFYIKVEGAAANVFGLGAYGMTLDVGASTSPVIPLPNTTKLNGSPLQGGGGIPDTYDPNGEIATEVPPAPTIAVSGSKPTQLSLVGTAQVGTTVTIYENGLAIGSANVSSDGRWTYRLPRKIAKGVHQFTAAATNSDGATSEQSATLVVTLRGRIRNR